MVFEFDKDGNLISGKIPRSCVKDCMAGGRDAAEYAEYWCKKLNFTVPRDLAERYLQSFGAWDDLSEANDETLAQRVLWMACGDIEENGYWHGLTG